MKIELDFKSCKTNVPMNGDNILYLAQFGSEGLLLCAGYKFPEDWYYDDISKIRVPAFKVEYWCEIPDFNIKENK